MCMGMEYWPVIFDLGTMTLTLCVPDGDGSIPHGAVADLVSCYLASKLFYSAKSLIS